MVKWRNNAKGRTNQYDLELNQYAMVAVCDNLHVDSVCDNMDTVIRILFSLFMYSNEIHRCHNTGRALPQMSSYIIFSESIGLILSTTLIQLPPPSQSGSHYVV